MTAEYLSKVGSALVRRCGTRDPFKIAKELGIEVLFCDDFGPLKGMYKVIKRNQPGFERADAENCLCPRTWARPTAPFSCNRQCYPRIYAL